MLLRRILIGFKLLELRRAHVLNNIIRLPLLEAEPQTLMAVILLIRLILVVLDLHEITVSGRRVQAQAHQAGDGSCLGNAAEGPGLLVLELDEVVVRSDHFVGLVDGGFEEFRQSKPLACHLVAVICVDELVVVDTVWGIAFDAVYCRLAAVECDDLGSVSRDRGRVVWVAHVIYECLSRWAQLDALRRVRLIVFACCCLSRFKLLSGRTRCVWKARVCAGCDVVMGRHI